MPAKGDRSEVLPYLEQRLKIHHLRVINAVCLNRSLLAASRYLHVGQPALTRTIKDIEAIVGTAVFIRHARGVRPTCAGEALLEASRGILERIQLLEDHLADQARFAHRTNRGVSSRQIASECQRAPARLE